jgi:hypothetical protein
MVQQQWLNESSILIEERKQNRKFHNNAERASVEAYSSTLEAMTKGKQASSNK